MIQKPPLRYDVIDPTRRTLTHVIDYQGSQVIADCPQHVPCDYCMIEVDRLWCYFTRPVSAKLPLNRHYVYSGGYWRACVFCRPLIGNAGLLAARVVSLRPEFAELAFALQTTWEVMWAARQGPEIEWCAGMRLKKWEGEPWRP